MSIPRGLIGGLVLAVYLWTAFPAAGETEGEPTTMDTVVVTAEKIEETFQTGDVEIEQTPAFVTVIEREQFEGKMTDVAEVINKEAGVQVRQSGGLGSFSSVSLRGSTSEQVMVFLDGVLLNDASGGGVDLSNISLDDVAAIEIYRGTSPINFGKTSIGGVVNIRTLRSKEGFNANASAGYGSFSTYKASAFINHKPGRWDYLISADYLDSENDFEIINNNGTPVNPGDDRVEKRNNAQVDQQNLLAKFGWDAGPDTRFELINHWFSKQQGLPSWNNSADTRTSFDTQRNVSTFKVTANDLGRYHLNSSTQLNYSWKEELYDDRYGQTGLGRQYNQYNTDRFGASSFLEWMTAINTLSGLVDYHHESYDPEDLLGIQQFNSSQRDNFSVGVQDSVFLFEDRLTLTPALRYTLVQDELNSATDAFGNALPGQSRDESYFTPQIGLKYLPLEWLTFKANVARYVREPSFFELFGDRGFFVGNMDLKSEEGLNVDAGIETNWRPSHNSVEWVQITAAYFQSDVDDLITRTYDARGIGKSVNVSSAFIGGVEAGLKANFLEFFRVVANATWLDTKNNSAVKAFNGKKLPGRFEKSYLARIEAHYSGVKLYAEAIAERDKFYDTANLLKAEDKDEFNAGLSWQYRSIRLNFDARNLGDNRYEDFNGYPLPGRSYFAGIKYDF